jgi:hypothetical protein
MQAAGKDLTPSPNSDPDDLGKSRRPRWLEGFEMKKRHGAEQIVGMLWQADVDLGQAMRGQGDRSGITPRQAW